MKEIDSEKFHQLFGVKKTRISYKKGDFVDYFIMIFICALVMKFAYGFNHAMSVLGAILCIAMVIAFPLRHGLALKMPVIVKRPQDILYMLFYKIRNLKPMYFFAIGILILENYLIYLTPNLPHNVELMRQIAIYLFFLHFISLSVYRTIILVEHLKKRDLVREVLMQTTWRGFLKKQGNITLEIFHAYFTGLLAHIVLITPWYLVIMYFDFSMIFLPAICLVNVFTQYSFLKVINAWFYRDHWLGHNAEIEFLYLHGAHHDAIPSGLIGVSGNGYLEGFMRHALGCPAPFYNPLVTFLVYSFEVKSDIDGHQYIPGIFPRPSKKFQEVNQHSQHHFGRLEPYGFGLNVDQPGISEHVKKALRFFPKELQNSIKLDEALTGFQWDNPRYRRYLDLFDKYQK